MAKDGRQAKARGHGRTRLAEVVAAQIEEEIIDQGWPVGVVLGSETELIQRFEVSRAVFREAVRIVEHHNVARMRRGPGGGLVVAQPDPTAVQTAVTLYLRYAGVKGSDLFEARVALELAATAAATERITEDGIRSLRETLAIEAELGAESLWQGHARHLHVVVAELTGNPAMSLFIDVLGRLNAEMIQRSSDRYPVPTERAAAESHQAHVAIVEAIASGDGALAQHRMRRHLDAIGAITLNPRPDVAAVVPYTGSP